MGWDLALVETGNGGDLTMNGQDFAVFSNDENEIFLRCFGGNIEADTKTKRNAGDEDKSYIGNLFFGNDPALWFNSSTERVLNNTELTSQGRVTIENAIKKDLAGLNCTVSVEIIATDRIKATIVQILPNGSENVMHYTWIKNISPNQDFDLGDFNSQDFN